MMKYKNGLQNVIIVKKCNVLHSKNIKFIISRNILIISLQRFNRFLINKTNSILIFDEFIDIKDLVDNSVDNQIIKYKLINTINHIGNINNAHYFSFIKIKDKWFEFNDINVKKIDQLEFRSNSVCVLFYEKQN